MKLNLDLQESKLYLQKSRLHFLLTKKFSSFFMPTLFHLKFKSSAKLINCSFTSKLHFLLYWTIKSASLFLKLTSPALLCPPVISAVAGRAAPVAGAGSVTSQTRTSAGASCLMCHTGAALRFWVSQCRHLTCPVKN